MDLESRLVFCRVALQGYSEADARRNPFGNGSERKSELEALVAYVAAESRGIKMNVSLDHPRMKEMYALGEKMFNFRGGTHDFACATCHNEDGKRIRLQELPNLTTLEGAQKAYTTWPAYRVSQGELRTFQWRLYDCFRQQRFPELVFGSDASIALTTFLARNANGAPFDAPAIKR
jgi:sulfur-oxidizing protein SoxA